MPDKNVDIPGVGVVAFPDSMSDEQIAAAAKQAYDAKQPQPSAFDTAKDVAAGFAKGAGRSVHAVVDDLPHLFGAAGLSDYIDMATGRAKGTSEKMVTTGLQPTNTAQRVGGYGETALEVALPVVAGGQAAAEAAPSMTRAGQAFQDVMAAAKSVPIDVEGPGQVALRVKQLQEAGATAPRAVTQLLSRMTDPDKAPLTYGEARDFYSNISRLSTNEYTKMNPSMLREVVNLKNALNTSITNAASAVGKGESYAGAMKEYAQAAKGRAMLDDVWGVVKKHMPAVAATATGMELYSKLSDLLK